MNLDFRHAVPRDIQDERRATLQQAGFAKGLSQGSCQRVIWEGNRCGFVHWDVEPDLVWLRMLCVVPEMQNKSIGSAAIAKVMSLSSYLKKPLYLNVFVCNRAAYDR